jgi:hypothetical protein
MRALNVAGGLLVISLSLASVASAQIAGMTTSISFSTNPSGATSATVTLNVRHRFAERALKGKPYSAKQVSEHLQVLNDGTKISSEGRELHLFRDSQGRTRREESLRMMRPGAKLEADQTTAADPVLVEIADPENGVAYILEPGKRVAHMVVQERPKPAADACDAPPAPAAPVAAKTPPAAPQFSTPTFSQEDLGTQTMEGLLVRGHRQTTVTPVGMVGNDRPLTQVCDTWSSIEWRVTVLSKCSDPRTGDSTTRLTNVDLSEPDPALFQVPSDYTVVEEKEQFTITLP